MIKVWFGFAAIAGLGFGIGFFAGERYGRKKEIAVQADIFKVVEEEKEKYKEKIKQEDPREENVKTILKEGYYYDITDSDIETMVKDTNEYLSQFESPSEEDTEEKEEPNDIQGEDKYIHIVNEDVWEQNTEYSPVELRYFDEDETVVDESDERVEEPEDSIGNKVLEYFRDFTDLDEQYVLNDWTMEIFKIVRVRDAYARVILGLDEDFEFYKDS